MKQVEKKTNFKIVTVKVTEAPLTEMVKEIMSAKTHQSNTNDRPSLVIIEKLKRLGLYRKPTYRFPMLDTIGIKLWEEMQLTNSLLSKKELF